MAEIIINQDFSNEDFNLFEKIDKKQFESQEFLDLKFQAQELSSKQEINELLCSSLLEKNLEYKLPHQPQGALKIIRDLNCTALLADEVGLGKTITTGIIIKECLIRGFAKKILILTPPSLVNQWQEELKEKFEIDFNILEKSLHWEKNNLILASLDKVKIYNKNTREFSHKKAHEIEWDLVIVDEAHKLKARNTVRWKFVDKLQKKRFLILTATPFQNDLLELYNLLHILKRGHLGTMKEFRKKFLNRGNKRYPLNAIELRTKLEELMVRRRRSKIGIDYKPRIPKIIPVQLTPEEKEIYDATCEMLKTQYFSANGDPINGKLIVFAILPKMTSSKASAIESLKRILHDNKYHIKTKEIAKKILEKYEQINTDTKMKKLVEIVEQIKQKDKNDKILIYTKHPTTLKYIVENLKHLNMKIIEFMGGLDKDEKSLRVKEFKENGDIFISTDSGAEGLNFQFCRNLINYDLPWNPMSVEQRIGRLDRIGQLREMHIYSLATKDTMEEYVVDLIINKMCCVGLVIGELPIILFNLGLDSEGKNSGSNKIEEKLMEAFIDSKNNLNKFANGVDEIAKKIEEGLKEYENDKKLNKDFLDDKITS
jgi:SNF2 family DNA or RNA helicase